jgi:nicotinamide-nucleotide amidase
VIIATGGLGPTRDDVSKSAACRYFDTGLVRDPEIMEELEIRFRKAGFSGVPERSLGQADVPIGATTLPNARGTARGIVLERDGKMLILLPGVPAEMKHLMTEKVVPLLDSRFGTAKFASAVVRTVGGAESVIAENIEKILTPEETALLSYYPKAGTVDVVISSPVAGSGTDLVESAARKIREALAQDTYATDDRTLEEAVSDLLRKTCRRLSVAESCTGGLLAKRITDLPGSSAVFECGAVAYSYESKSGFLGVDKETIMSEGAVSEPVCRAMAEGMLERSGADYAISITGVAGPTGGTEEKPVGTVYIGLAAKDRETLVQRFTFGGDREIIRERTATKALEVLWRSLLR